MNPYKLSEMYFEEFKAYYHKCTEHGCTEALCENYSLYIFNIEMAGTLLVRGFEHLINEAYLQSYKCHEGKGYLPQNIFSKLNLSQKIEYFVYLADLNLSRAEFQALLNVKNLRNNCDHCLPKYNSEGIPCEDIASMIKLIESSIKILIGFIPKFQKVVQPQGEFICYGYIDGTTLEKTMDKIIETLSKDKKEK